MAFLGAGAEAGLLRPKRFPFEAIFPRPGPPVEALRPGAIRWFSNEALPSGQPAEAEALPL